jgi:hypothetical protein
MNISSSNVAASSDPQQEVRTLFCYPLFPVPEGQSSSQPQVHLCHSALQKQDSWIGALSTNRHLREAVSLLQEILHFYSLFHSLAHSLSLFLSYGSPSLVIALSWSALYQLVKHQRRGPSSLPSFSTHLGNTHLGNTQLLAP